jgi:hypothetical protein
MRVETEYNSMLHHIIIHVRIVAKLFPTQKQFRGPEEFIDTIKNIQSAFAGLHYVEQGAVCVR